MPISSGTPYVKNTTCPTTPSFCPTTPSRVICPGPSYIRTPSPFYYPTYRSSYALPLFPQRTITTEVNTTIENIAIISLLGIGLLGIGIHLSRDCHYIGEQCSPLGFFHDVCTPLYDCKW